MKLKFLRERVAFFSHGLRTTGRRQTDGYSAMQVLIRTVCWFSCETPDFLEEFIYSCVRLFRDVGYRTEIT